MAADSQLRAQYPSLGTQAELESWLARKMAINQGLTSRRSGVLTIPVVVHIVHDGEPVGVGANLSYAQIQSQIDVLNEDYRRAPGTPGFNNHPDGADPEIEFCLASVGPDGQPLPEPGVHRINRQDEGWAAPPYLRSFMLNTVLPATFWNPDAYMNIWVAPLANDVLGFAQFPIQSGIPDLINENGAAATDGVVIRSTSFGRVGNVEAPYNQGRSATHEIGHWLGLKHTWGDGNCSVDDFCADTPESDDGNYSCPTGHLSCGTVDMIENYLDYTDDACMSIFTQCQKQRMRTVLQNSPRRASLLNSAVCSTDLPPIADFAVSQPQVCAGNSLQFFDRSLYGPASWSWTFTGGSPASSTQRDPVVNYAQPGIYDVRLEVSNAFGANAVLRSGYVIVNASGPNPFFVEDFEDGIQGLGIQNPDNSFTWQAFSVGGSNNGSQAAGINLYDYSSTGNRDGLVSPTIDLGAYTEVSLGFEHAYRPFSSFDRDSLIVWASTDNGGTWPHRLLAIGADGTARLPTGPESTSKFTPTTDDDWCYSGGTGPGCFELDLSQFDGERNFRLRFEAVNDYGNNIYVDNVELRGICNPFVALDPPGEAFSLRLYPNPSAGAATLEVAGLKGQPATCLLHDLFGREISRWEIPAGRQQWQQTLSAPPSSGIYLLSLRVGEQVLRQRWVVQ
jgi:PKD repeat protein